MRRIIPALPILAACALASTAHAQSQPLLGVEAQLGGGVAFGGGSGIDRMRLSSATVGATVDYAVVAQPWTSVVGGVFYEGSERAGVGVELGARVAPGAAGGAATGRAAVRVGAGLVAVMAPYTIYGASASCGSCFRSAGAMSVCVDLTGRLFALGDDLPDDSVAGQLVVQAGVRLDVW